MLNLVLYVWLHVCLGKERAPIYDYNADNLLCFLFAETHQLRTRFLLAVVYLFDLASVFAYVFQ